MLKISNLSLKVNQKIILEDIDLEIKKGQICAIIGKNGSGKTSLAKFICGLDEVEKKTGEMIYKGFDLTSLDIETRANMGIFMSFQEPVSVPGLSFINFIKATLQSKAKFLKESLSTSSEILEKVKKEIQRLGLPTDFYLRDLNHNLSGGEKKQMELLQISLLNPDLVILDEIDSGLDIDKVDFLTKNLKDILKNKACLVITHNVQFIKNIKPDILYTIKDTKLVKLTLNSLKNFEK